jgi:drug/metabolite transporter (DMT)-like permease
MNDSHKGILLMMISAASFGAMAPLAKMIYSYDISPSFMLTVRFMVAALILWSFVLVKTPQKGRTLTKNQLITLFGIGGIVYFLLAITYFNAIRFIPVTLHVVIFYTYPLIVNLIAFFFLKEKFTISQVLALFIALVGLALTASYKGVTLNLTGVILSFISAACYAAYMLLLGKKSIRSVDSLVVAAYTNLFTAISFTVYCVAKGEFYANVPLLGWLGILFIGVVSTALAIITLSMGIRLIGAAKASIVSTFEPLEGILLSVLFLGEVLDFKQLLGIVLILSAILILNYKTT